MLNVNVSRERKRVKEETVGINEGPKTIAALVALKYVVYSLQSRVTGVIGIHHGPEMASSPLHRQKGMHWRSHSFLRLFSALSIYYVIHTCMYHSCLLSLFNTVDFVRWKSQRRLFFEVKLGRELRQLVAEVSQSYLFPNIEGRSPGHAD